ncbi:MAG: NACHT domain-containing protein [Calothrix sp. MO_167.B12]|nr:NACHT domain-containing protein [Calothrix sp. MO_167.B12]
MYFKKQNLLVIFVLALTVSITFGTILPVFTQVPPSTSTTIRQELVEKIQDYAERHVNSDTPMKTEFVIKLYRKNSVGLSEREIAEIYKTEYLRLDKDKQRRKKEQTKNPWRQLPQGISGWIAAIILFILLIFRDLLKDLLKKITQRISYWLYKKFAGMPLFENIALKKYRQALIDKYQQLKIPFRPKEPLEMRKVYVPLTVAETSVLSQMEAENAIQQYHRLMVKGAPGSGKSILLKYLALSYAEGRLINLSDRPVPILLELNRLNDANLTLKKLEQQLVEICDLNDFPKANRFISEGLKQGRLMLFLDGLDEVSSSVRSHVIQCLKYFLDKYKKCRAIITCRTAVYNNEFFHIVDQTLEIVEFSDQQIRRFLQGWKSQMPPDKSVEQLIQTLRDRPKIMALARNPLLLTIIAYLYTDTPFVLPHSRAEFYTKATDVLLELRDQERSIPNKYTGVNKRLVLQNLALFAQDNANRQQQDRRSLDVQEVWEQVKQVLPSLNLEPQEANSIVDEIVYRSGLLLPIDGGQRYQFAHLTLQEYFVAAALRDRQDELIQRWQNAPSDWREIVKLWCGLVNDSTPVIKAVYQRDSLTAFECLADAQNIKPQLAGTIINNFQVKLGTVSGDEKEAVEKAFAAVAADTRPRGKAVFQFLENQLGIAELEDDFAQSETNFQWFQMLINPTFMQRHKLITNREIRVRTVAANALSLTNLPNAVKTLARNYSSQPEVRQALIRMGDLAVPSLGDLATNGSVDAFDDLTEIKTPEAAKILLPLLWNQDTRLAQLAAWRLAVLLPLPNVEDTLRGYSLTEEQKQADYLRWIWDPFTDKDHDNSNLPIIASTIAAKLIEESSIDSAPARTVQLDPRIVIPLCAIELRSQANWTQLKRGEQLPQPLAQVVSNILGKESELEEANWTQLKYGEQLLQPLAQVVSNILGKESEVEVEVEVEVKDMEKVFDKFSEQSPIPESTEKKLQFIEKFLESAEVSPLWRHLFDSLEPNLRFKLLRRLWNSYPSRNDWSNIFRRVEDEFRRGWDYVVLLLGIITFISIVSLVIMAVIVLYSPSMMTWNNGLIVASAVPVIFFWLVVGWNDG